MALTFIFDCEMYLLNRVVAWSAKNENMVYTYEQASEWSYTFSIGCLHQNCEANLISVCISLMGPLLYMKYKSNIVILWQVYEISAWQNTHYIAYLDLKYFFNELCEKWFVNLECDSHVVVSNINVPR